jgi:hypothetical protein
LESNDGVGLGKEARLTGGVDRSATHGVGGKRGARELGLRRFAGLGPSGKQGREAGRARERRRGALSGCCWARPNPIREMKILFFFFSNFSKHFQINFEFPFEFESNHSSQKFKCNSMSAQTCSTLIFDFKLIKIIITLNLHDHKIV